MLLEQNLILHKNNQTTLSSFGVLNRTTNVSNNFHGVIEEINDLGKGPQLYGLICPVQTRTLEMRVTG